MNKYYRGCLVCNKVDGKQYIVDDLIFDYAGRWTGAYVLTDKHNTFLLSGIPEYHLY